MLDPEKIASEVIAELERAAGVSLRFGQGVVRAALDNVQDEALAEGKKRGQKRCTRLLEQSARLAEKLRREQRRFSHVFVHGLIIPEESGKYSIWSGAEARGGSWRQSLDRAMDKCREATE